MTPTITSARFVLAWEYAGERVIFHGTRCNKTGRLAPPTQEDFDRFANGKGVSPSEHATWSRALTSPVRWAGICSHAGHQFPAFLTR